MSFRRNILRPISTCVYGSWTADRQNREVEFIATAGDDNRPEGEAAATDQFTGGHSQAYSHTCDDT